ncbi:ComF family protein [Breznakiellaceae bacterium SP9]
MKKLLKILRLIEEYLFPAGCALCARTLLSSEEAWYGLCTECKAELTLPHDTRCTICGRPLVSERGTCLSCRASSTRSFQRIICILPYAGRYKKLLHAYKYGRMKALGHVFTELIEHSIPLFEGAAPATLVPVPPRPGKIKREAWDQIEYLAKLLGPHGKHPLQRCLKRLQRVSQKQLDQKSRMTNLISKIIFDAGKKAPLRAIIFDDVLTTGATIEACAAALKQAGAQEVYGLCLFCD